MEEEKATTYYNELTRRGEGATRFKKGLGFSSVFRNSNDAVPARGSALVSSSSFLNSFVRASSPSKTTEFIKQEVKEYITARSNTGKDRTATVDYRRLIEGYEKMTPAERVKAKMKLQLSESARKEETNSMGSGWERFDFDKDAPLDDEEIEAVEDDGALVNHTGKSFRFSAVATRREEKIKAAHDEAIFGAPSLLLLPPSTETDDEAEEDNCKEDISKVAPAISLISGQALAMQQGSWRDRARRS
ncbi:hypothetical protein P3S68_021923 [Capsicum galapagoense]